MRHIPRYMYRCSGGRRDRTQHKEGFAFMRSQRASSLIRAALFGNEKTVAIILASKPMQLLGVFFPR